MDKRRVEEGLFKAMMVCSTAIIIFILALILSTVIFKGLPAMKLSMVTQTPKGGYYAGKEGGALNAILGSLYITAGATACAFFIGLAVSIYLNIYRRRRSRAATLIRFCLDVMWGIPSIVYGAFGFSVMIFLGVRTSLLAGMVTVTLFILPIMCRAMDEVIRMLPEELLEASYALGATKLETAWGVVVRQALPGVLTAALLSFGRGIGDAASVLFTAGYTDQVPYSLFSPAATLPLAIFFQLGTPFPETQERAYASAFILTVIVLLVSIAGRVLSRRLSRHIVT